MLYLISDGGEWTDGRSRTARAADKVKLQRTAPPLLRSIKSDQSKRMSHGKLNNNIHITKKKKY
jgi:hypothetical protein